MKNNLIICLDAVCTANEYLKDETEFKVNKYTCSIVEPELRTYYANPLWVSFENYIGYLFQRIFVEEGIPDKWFTDNIEFFRYHHSRGTKIQLFRRN